MRFWLLLFGLLGALALFLPMREGLVPDFAMIAAAPREEVLRSGSDAVRVAEATVDFRIAEARAASDAAVAEKVVDVQTAAVARAAQVQAAAEEEKLRQASERPQAAVTSSAMVLPQSQEIIASAPAKENERLFYDGEDGGCFHIHDRVECCKYKDGRVKTEYGGKNCVPSKPGMLMSGNICEPEGAGHEAGDICLTPEVRAKLAEEEKVKQQRVAKMLEESGKRVPYKIFTYWNYGSGPDPFVALNQETWRAHAPPGTEIVHVNDSNFRNLVPDAPEEVFRMPYAAANSDIVRAAVLYHQGGLYMDADFMVLGPLDEIFKKLDEGWDIVAYTDSDGRTGECGSAEYSSNFMAARKGNPFSQTWWTNIKHKLTRICDVDEYSVEKTCCHEAFAKEPERRKCHIPWGHLEWLKIPRSDPDLKPLQMDPTQRRRSAPSSAKQNGPEAEKFRALVAAGNARSQQWPPGMRTYCMRGADGMAPHLNGEVYWQPWNAKEGTTHNGPYKQGQYDQRFSCKELAGGDLECKKGNWGNQHRTLSKFFGRISYHLFFSTKKPHDKTRDEVLNGDYLVSEMYRRSLKK